MSALLPRKSFREMERLNHLFDHMIDRMYAERLWPAEFEIETGAYVAPVECFMRNSNCVVGADVPGMEPKDVEVSLLGNALTIKGERKRKEEVTKEDYLRKEIAYGAFERRLTLPESVEADKVKAEFKNGVIEVTVPLAKEMATKKIPLAEAK